MKRESIITDECPACGNKISHEYGSTVVCAECGELKGEETHIINKSDRGIEYGTF